MNVPAAWLGLPLAIRDPARDLTSVKDQHLTGLMEIDPSARPLCRITNSERRKVDATKLKRCGRCACRWNHVELGPVSRLVAGRSGKDCRTSRTFNDSSLVQPTICIVARWHEPLLEKGEESWNDR